MTFDKWFQTKEANEAVIRLMSTGAADSADGARRAMHIAWDACARDVARFMDQRTPSTKSFQDLRVYLAP